jgi:hypothetical protein
MKGSKYWGFLFSKRKVKEFVNNRLALQEVLKEVLWTKEESLHLHKAVRGPAKVLCFGFSAFFCTI